jgi:hypothetical protein
VTCGQECCSDGFACRAGRCIELVCGEGGPCTVFVTGSTHSGKFGGIAGADAICQGEAEAAGLSGVFMAWLSDDATSPSVRFMQSTGPYVRPDGVRIAADWAGLTDGGLDAAIAVDASGNGIPADEEVWTATMASGSADSGTCNNWQTDDSLSGDLGSADSSGIRWTEAARRSCGFYNRLYCFQQSA